MAIFNGIILYEEDQTFVNGQLFKCSSITAVNDMVEMTPENSNSFASLPIYFNCYNNIPYDTIETIYNSLNDLILTTIDTTKKHNSTSMFIDSLHLQGEPENATIRSGNLQGIEKVLYVEIYGK